MKFSRKSNSSDYFIYFRKIPEFLLLPEFYQNRIISFFLQERHYMVDPTDVKFFLDKGKQFAVFMSFEDLVEFNKDNLIKKILGCKLHFISMDRLSDWLDKLHNEIKSNEVCVLAHSFGFEFDNPEEWYIANY